MMSGLFQQLPKSVEISSQYVFHIWKQFCVLSIDVTKWPRERTYEALNIDTWSLILGLVSQPSLIREAEGDLLFAPVVGAAR